MFLIVGDAEIVKFLTEEISSEKSNQKALPKLAGWEVINIDKLNNKNADLIN